MEVPRTLLVTNDYPPRVGGIQRTLEALVRRLPPDRVAVLCPDADGAAAFDEEAAYRVFRQPERFLWPTPEVGRRVRDAVRGFGAEVVMFGATYPLALLGPGLARSGTPYVAAAHGFEYWLSVAPGPHALLRRATSRTASSPPGGHRDVFHVVARPDPLQIGITPRRPRRLVVHGLAAESGEDQRRRRRTRLLTRDQRTAVHAQPDDCENRARRRDQPAGHFARPFR